MHFAKLSESFRLQSVMNILSDFGEHSTFEIMRATNSCAVHSDISELRANGIPIKRIYRGKNQNGRQLNFYQLKSVNEWMEKE